MTTTIPTPHFVRLRAELSGKDLPGLVERVRELAEAAGMPAPVAFESPPGGTARPIDQLDPARLIDAQLELVLEDDLRIALSAHPGLTGSLVQASIGGEPLPEAEVRDAQRRQTRLLDGLLATGRLRAGHVERVEPGLDALASVPLARRLPALVATEAEVAAAYADPAPFWAAWDEERRLGEHRLLWRHLDAATSADWFRACFDDQWAMARAANPGDTFFGDKVAPPGCEDVLMRGEGRLRQVGHRDGHVELAAFVPPGEHVPPWEILTWNEVLLRGRLDDGSPVSRLRVVFRDEEMARREATPLLDIGAQVAFLGRDGLYHPVE